MKNNDVGDFDVLAMNTISTNILVIEVYNTMVGVRKTFGTVETVAQPFSDERTILCKVAGKIRGEHVSVTVAWAVSGAHVIILLSSTRFSH